MRRYLRTLWHYREVAALVVAALVALAATR
jgi:hypothetical protein